MCDKYTKVKIGVKELKDYIPVVKDISLYKEIAKNIINPLEVIREAISNSVDASATHIIIDIYRNENGLFCIKFKDNGNGMDIREISSFFNLGDSKKDIRKIGEKGLGTKTFFGSEKISVETQKNNCKRYIAEMNKPWEMLRQNIVPTYNVKEVDMVNDDNGTIVIIEGYLLDSPEKIFNFETIRDYILWFTAGGSFKSLFASFPELNNYVNNMQVTPRIFINDYVQNINEEIAGAHQFCQPQENPDEDINEKIYKKSINYCRHFGPYHRSTNIDGEYISFQMYGTISGYNCRKSICKLKQCERIKGRFGIYLAKDFIPITKARGVINEWNNENFHILINSQNFELTADRNNISNIEDKKIKWIFSTIKKIIETDVLPIVEAGYMRMRRQEELIYKIYEKNKVLNARINNCNKLRKLNIEGVSLNRIPDNEAQVVLLLAILLSKSEFKTYIKEIDSISHYSHQSTTDLICLDKQGQVILVEVEFLISNIFRHEHPIDTFNCIVCWKIDMEVNERKTLIDGTELKLIKKNNNWKLTLNSKQTIPIICLSEIVRRLNKFKIR